MLCAIGNEQVGRQIPSPAMDSWSEHRRRLSQLHKGAEVCVSLPVCGYFKVHVRAMTVSRWIVCKQLPLEVIYHEWLYVGADGVPSLYWSDKLKGVILI